MIPVDGQTMLEIAPRFSGAKAQRQAEIVREVGAVLAETLAKYTIDTRLRVAHFLAQTCHESAGFRTTEEFADGSAYENRADLGNVKAGDGPRYKGRGLLQLTGRANYRHLGGVIGLDLEADPERAAEPALSLRIACEFWKAKGINALCDGDDVVAVTRRINGGVNGLDDRRALTSKAKTAVARIAGLQLTGAAPVADAEVQPVLRRGSLGPAVESLQQLLQQHRFAIAVDGEFGAATELAVMRVQADAGLLADGIVGPVTWAALAPEAAVAKVG